jgi:hypothetical protein
MITVFLLGITGSKGDFGDSGIKTIMVEDL